MKEITTKLFSCNSPSRSGRIYPKDVMENALNEFKENYKNGLLCSPDTLNPFISDSAGVVEDIKMEENGDVFGKILFFDNIPGKTYQNILDKTDIEIRPAGFSVIKNNVVKKMDITHFNIHIMDKNKENKIEDKNTVVIPNIDSLKNVTIKFKKLDENAVIPSYAHNGDVGMDLTAISLEYDVDKDLYIYHTGLALESDYGYGTFLFPRSSNCKTEAYLTNHVGIADSAIYRGEIQLRYKNRDKYKKSFWEWLTRKVNVERALKKAPFNVGDRVGQMVVLPYPQVHVQVVDELSETERGTGGFGSTGK